MSPSSPVLDNAAAHPLQSGWSFDAAASPKSHAKRGRPKVKKQESVVERGW